jgi:hypothetical protein
MDGPIGLSVDHQVVSDRRVQDVLQRRRVHDGGHEAVGLFLLEQQPGIGALWLSGRGTAGKCEPALVDKRPRHADHAGLFGLIQVQTAGIVARPQSSGDKTDSRERRVAAIKGQPQRFASGRIRRIMNQGQDRLGDQRKTPGAPAAASCIARVLPKGVHRHQKECGGRHQAHRRETPARPPRDVVPPEPHQRDRTRAVQHGRSRAPQPT